MISTDSIVAAREEQLTSKLDRESIVLQMDSGKYFGFEAVGQRIWELVQQPRRVSEIRDAVAAEYDVDPDKCERDLLTFLQQMQAAGLIEVQDA